MPNLLLIRHSETQQDPAVSSHVWTLTDAGRARCLRLAAQVSIYDPAVIVTSPERKAMQTGQLVTAVLDVPLEIEPGLHEQRRETAPYGTPAEFQARIHALLTRPDELVFGEETGTAARIRFQAAIQAALNRHPDETVAVVTHGTVMTLFLARVAEVEPVAFWQSLGMPGYVVLNLPDFRVIETVSEVV